jgi:hypothetical protein
MAMFKGSELCDSCTNYQGQRYVFFVSLTQKKNDETENYFCFDAVDDQFDSLQAASLGVVGDDL